MTKLLQKAIEKIQSLPEEMQDAIGSRLLAELDDEQQWDSSFASTTADQWEKMAAMAYQEIAIGETVPLDEVFPG